MDGSYAMDGSYYLGALIGGAVMGVITLLIHKKKGYSPVTGFLLGFLLGLIGLIVVLVEKDNNKGE